MKKLIIILSVLLTISVVGVLYGTHDQLNEEETATPEWAYDFNPDPMPGIPLY